MIAGIMRKSGEGLAARIEDWGIDHIPDQENAQTEDRKGQPAEWLVAGIRGSLNRAVGKRSGYMQVNCEHEYGQSPADG